MRRGGRGVEGDEVMCFGKKTAVAAAAALLSAAATASASPVTVLKAKVPFGFEVNGHTWPAGTYLIQRDEMSAWSVLYIKSANRGDHSMAIVTTIPDGGQDPAGTQPALTFKRHKNQTSCPASGSRRT